MTNAQAAWLKANPTYEILGAVGVSPSGDLDNRNMRHTAIGSLYHDGSFVKGVQTAGAVLVGIRRAALQPAPGGMIPPR